MNKELEIENKYILSSNDFEILKNYILWDKEVIQTNYYYDTDNFTLNQQGLTLRIREIENKKQLQYKTKNINIFSNAKIRKEYMFDYDELPPKISKQELPICGHDVIILGSLKTVRLVKDYHGVSICLDYNSYLGTCDFELEIEYRIKNLYKVMKIRRELEKKVTLRHTKDGKFTRFVRRLQDKNGVSR